MVGSTDLNVPTDELTWLVSYFITRKSPVLFTQNGKVHHDKEEAEDSDVNQATIAFSQDKSTPRAT